MAEAKHHEKVSVAMKSIFETIMNFESYPSFASGVKAAKITERSENTLVVDMDLEMIKRVSYQIDVSWELSDDAARVWWTLKSGELFKRNDGEWRLKVVDENTTDVTYSLDVEFNFSVPGFILKNLIKKSLPQAVHDFTNKAQNG